MIKKWFGIFFIFFIEMAGYQGPSNKNLYEFLTTTKKETKIRKLSVTHIVQDNSLNRCVVSSSAARWIKDYFLKKPPAGYFCLNPKCFNKGFIYSSYKSLQIHISSSKCGCEEEDCSSVRSERRILVEKAVFKDHSFLKSSTSEASHSPACLGDLYCTNHQACALWCQYRLDYEAANIISDDFDFSSADSSIHFLESIFFTSSNPVESALHENSAEEDLRGLGWLYSYRPPLVVELPEP